ncbi:MAG: glycosyltransferase family 4 protein [Methylophilus sp.]
MKKYKFYYSIVDSYPAFRVDVIDLFRSLSQLGNIEVEWFMTSGKPTSKTQVLMGAEKVHLPIKLAGRLPIIKVINKVFYWVFDIFGLLNGAFKNISLFQTRDKYFASLFALLIARLKGVKYTYWCSYPFPEQDLEHARNAAGFKRLVYTITGYWGFFVLYKIVIPLSDHAFVQSEQMRSDMTKYGIKPEKMTPVPMGVPNRIFDIDTSRILIKPKQFAYVGTLAAIRRMHVLVEAFAEVVKHYPDARLMIVGDGIVPTDRLGLEQQADQLGLSHAVTFTGFVSIDMAWEIAATSQCCISPFFPTKVLASTSPTKLVEYMALGRPVVCNDHPEQKQIIEASGAGLCVPWGVQAFADAMIWMLENPDQAEQMAKKGPDWVRKNRTYSVIAENVWQVYQGILKQ